MAAYHPRASTDGRAGTPPGPGFRHEPAPAEARRAPQARAAAPASRRCPAKRAAANASALLGMRRFQGRVASGRHAQAREDLAIEERVRLPGLGGDQAPVAHSLLVDERGAGEFGFSAHVPVARHALAGGESGGGQHLYAVADGEDPLAGTVEAAEDLEQRIVVAQILGGAPAQQQDGLVVLDAHLVEANVGFEPIAPAFNIGIPTGLESVHHQVQAAAGGCGQNGLPAFLLEAVDGVESFVGFAAIAGYDEDFRHASNLARSAVKFTRTLQQNPVSADIIPGDAIMTANTARPQAPWALRLLPPFPAIAHRILALASQEDVGAHEVGALITLDPSFPAPLLRFANSPLSPVRPEHPTLPQP